jgi:hypothetical protein
MRSFLGSVSEKEAICMPIDASTKYKAKKELSIIGQRADFVDAPPEIQEVRFIISSEKERRYGTD